MNIISLVAFTILFIIAVRELLKVLPRETSDVYPSTNICVFLCFMAYVIIWYTQLSYRMEERFGGSIRVEAIVGGILLILVFFNANSDKKTKSAGLTPYLIALTFVVAIQVPNSMVPDISKVLFVDNYVKYLAMSLFIIVFVRAPQYMFVFIIVWALACWKITMEGVIGGLTGSLVWENQGVMRLHGSVPKYSHPTSLSLLALNVMPFIYYLYTVSKSKWIKIFFILLAFQSLYCILYSGSRTGYLGIFMFLVFVWWRINKKLKVKAGVIIIMLGVLSVLFAPNQYKERFMSSFIGQEREGQSKVHRIEQYSQGLSILMDHPFGLGLGGYRSESVRRFDRDQEIHCLYLEIATHMGIQGLIVFMALIVKLLSIAKKLISDLDKQLLSLRKLLVTSIRNDELKASVTGHITGLEIIKAVSNATVVFLLIRLFVGIFSMDFYNIHWWFSVGVLWAGSYMAQRASLATQELVERAKCNA